MLPRQMQIWSVLHANDSDQRLVYSLAATFLGRMCLSGDVLDVDDQQWNIARQAIAMYQQAAPTIRLGRSRGIRAWGASLRRPADGRPLFDTPTTPGTLLVVIHTFENGPSRVEVQLDGEWAVTASFYSDVKDLVVAGGAIQVDQLRPFDGVVVLLERARPRGGRRAGQPR